MARAVEDRFFEKVDRSGDCWLWTAALYKSSGYGVFRAGPERHMRAHRWSYEHFIGPIPEGLAVCHRCDVRHCVRPEHLFLGTAADNQADMTSKGRGRVGQRNGAARLTRDDIAEIRRLYPATAASQHGPKKGISRAELAKRYGISGMTIYRIATGVRPAR